MTGVLDNLDQADVFESAPFFQAGRYIVRIELCKLNNGHKGTNFIIESTVLGVKSDHPEAPGPGTRAAEVWNASRTPEKVQQAKATWIGFLCAAYGVGQKDFDGARWKAISADVLDNNSLKGVVLLLECHMIKTRADTDFTVHTWRGAPTPEVLAEFGLGADGSPLGGAASTPEPMRNVDTSGRAILSHDGGASWVYE